MTTQVYYITSTAQLNRLLIQLKQSALVNETPAIYRIGFDLEYITSNEPAEWVLNTVKNRISCVIQLATAEICFVINLTKLGPHLPSSLIKIITNANWIKYGIGIDEDMKLLSQNYELGHCSGSYELKTLAEIHKLPSPSLKTLASQYLALKVRKTLQCNWSGKLKTKQVKYAAIDAIVSYHLGCNSLIFEPKTTQTTLELDLNIPKNETNVEPVLGKNYIGELQEYAAKNGKELPNYIERTNSGNFVVECHFEGKVTSGSWISKKNAKKIAAGRMCFLVFGVEPTEDNVDYISKLNLHHQANNYLVPVYSLKPSDDNFVVKCSYTGQTAIGRGPSKKVAKNDAAKQVWQLVTQK